MDSRLRNFCRGALYARPRHEVNMPTKARWGTLVRATLTYLPAIAALVLAALCVAPRMSAQTPAALGLDPAELLKQPTDAWPTYHGDYTGRRYSTLDQINQKNVDSLTLAWVFSTRGLNLKSTPLEVNGILYFTSPDNVWAVDARLGREIWHYETKTEGGKIGHRGVAMWKDYLYFETGDAHLVSLNARDGKERWRIELADAKLGYFATMAPLVIRDHLLAGVSGDSTDIRGLLRCVDPETGAIQWTWYVEPDPGAPGSETWPKDPEALLHGGGMTWMTGTYDPALNLVYWGTGNPNPVMVGDQRPGDNLYTCTIVALNPDTGKLQWYFQPSPHDTHDWDAVQTPILFDADFHGKPRKLVAQASRNGFFFVLDRTTGEHLVTSPFIETTWSKGIDERGRPIADPRANPRPDGALAAPGSDGATNWMSPSFSPQTNLFYVNAHRLFSVYYRTIDGKVEGWGGRDQNLWGSAAIRALDYKTGKVVWTHELGEGEPFTGIMTTAGRLLFSGDASGNFLALDPGTGKTLWHLNLGGNISSSPMTYQLDGRQYVVVAVHDHFYAFSLPETTVARAKKK